MKYYFRYLYTKLEIDHIKKAVKISGILELSNILLNKLLDQWKKSKRKAKCQETDKKMKTGAIRTYTKH